jgi:hypothetical protein
MHRICDDCKGIFKISKLLEKRLLNEIPTKIYCPYCNGVYSHTVIKQFKYEIIQAKRGELWMPKRNILITQEWIKK